MIFQARHLQRRLQAPLSYGFAFDCIGIPFGLSLSKPFDKLRANGAFCAMDCTSVSVVRAGT